MSTTAATPGVSRFELALDELSLLRDHIPGLILPSFVRPSLGRDESVLFESLRERELINKRTLASEADWIATIAPAVKLALALQMSGDLVFQITAWNATEMIEHSSTVTRGVASGLTVATARSNGQLSLRPADATVTLAPVAALATLLAELVPSATEVDGAQNGAPVTIGLVESRALIAAIRVGDPRVIGAVASEVHAPRGPSVFSQLAGPITTGFRVKVFTPSGGCLYSGDWFHGANTWLKVFVAASSTNSSFTAQAIIDSGAVTISAVTARSIEVELLSLVSEGVRDTYVE